MGKEYLDSSLKPEIRAKALLKEMSLEEKVAQLTACFLLMRNIKTMMSSLRVRGMESGK